MTIEEARADIRDVMSLPSSESITTYQKKVVERYVVLDHVVLGRSFRPSEAHERLLKSDVAWPCFSLEGRYMLHRLPPEFRWAVWAVQAHAYGETLEAAIGKREAASARFLHLVAVELVERRCHMRARGLVLNRLLREAREILCAA